MTRYVNLRKYAEMDDEVACTWAPANHHMPPEMRSRWMPDSLSLRMRLLRQASPVLSHPDKFDAVMLHLFEADLLYCLRSYFIRGPVHISSTDEAPIVDRSSYPLYPDEIRKPVWRQRMRLAIDRWRVRRTDGFIPFSRWVADILVDKCAAPRRRVHPIHVGLDLDHWTGAVRRRPSDASLPKILFVGGDFVRKGGPLLVDVFTRHFQDEAELHLVTRQAPLGLPRNVFVHADVSVNDGKLADLYASAAMLVIPTTADTGPLWAYMEAFAMRVPAIGTRTGSNDELLRHAENGFIVPIGDGNGLAEAIRTLLQDPVLRARMGEQGRRLVEDHYSARKNVPRILSAMKSLTDERRSESAARRG